MKLKSFKKITYNWHIKLLSVVLAFIMWLYVDSLQEKERFFSVPLEIRNVPPEYIVSNEIPQFVKLVVRGKEETLSLIDSEGVTAYLDFGNNIGQSNRVAVKVDRENIPDGVSIKEISPRMVEVRIAKVITKKVRVVPVIVSKLPNGYTLEDLSIEPEFVEVRGPESLLEGFDSIYTEEIDIGSLTETTIIDAHADTSDARIALVGEAHITVKVNIKEEYVVKWLEGVPVVPVNLKEGLRASVQDGAVSLLLRMPRRIEQSLTVESLSVYFDCSGIEKPGYFHLPILYHSDFEEVTLVRANPQSVKIKIER